MQEKISYPKNAFFTKMSSNGDYWTGLEKKSIALKINPKGKINNNLGLGTMIIDCGNLNEAKVQIASPLKSG